jgi:soluble lytic murein transglycosylase-like protein
MIKNKNLIIPAALIVSFFIGRFSVVEEIPKLSECPVDTLETISKSDPPCIQMYHYIEKYSRMYNIPRKYAYGIAFKETTYLGPDHIDYNPYRTSSAGAVGPMQVMPATAEMVNGKRPTRSKLKNDIEYNIKTSMKLLRRLKDKHKDWKTVFGAYNTGKPIINKYANDVYCYIPTW